MTIVKRAFADLPHGQLHYRYAGTEHGDTVPLVLFHASPGSSRQLQKLVEDLATARWVIAPDTPGNGDSPPVAAEETTVELLAETMLAFLDAMELPYVDVYGSHTGACIATELATLAPGRVRSVILDGIAAFTEEEQEDVLAHYAHSFTPDNTGAYLVNMHHFCRDQHLFFPWYRHRRDSRRDGGVASAQDLHIWLLEVMKGCQTYHYNYRAAFKWDGNVRSALCRQPTLLMCSESDPLVEHTKALAAVFPKGHYVPLPRFDDVNFVMKRSAEITRFLGSV